MMFTNLDKHHGGNFRDVLERNLIDAQKVRIASGYVSLHTIQAYSSQLESIARTYGNVQLMLGMAFYEGLSTKQYDACLDLNTRLSAYSNSGVYVAHGRRYHGKIYDFNQGDKNKIFVGSSNFSPSGLAGNIECTVEIIDSVQKGQVNNFLDSLFVNHSEKIDDVVINTGSRTVVTLTVNDKYRRLLKHTRTIDNSLPNLMIDLERIAEKPSSNLNVYFGKGRENKQTGKIIPRPWYEIEIISSNDINSLPNYPKGDFYAYTDDGLIIPMKTQGDYFKNLRSKDSLQIFGMWLKGKLERAGVLKKYDPVTIDTLREYGNSQLKLYKISANEYFMSF